MTDGTPSPDLVGLHPDDAARPCFERGLDLHVVNTGLVWSYWGHGQLRHVTEQVPGAGQLMSSPTIAVHVSLRNRPDARGVREPRRPLPTDHPMLADDRD